MTQRYGVVGATAGLLGFSPTHGGLKATVIPANAYPASAGVTVLRFVRQLVKDHAVDEAADRVKQLVVHVPDLDGDPEPEDVAALKVWAAPGTNPEWHMDWWTLLARTLGNPDAILTSGHLVSAADFAGDSLFCEWGYVINFRSQELEVYRGLQTVPPLAGRWAGGEDMEEQVIREERYRETGRDYFAINEVARFSFSNLPTDEAFVTHTANWL